MSKASRQKRKDKKNRKRDQDPKKKYKESAKYLRKGPKVK